MNLISREIRLSNTSKVIKMVPNVAKPGNTQLNYFVDG